MLLDDSDVNKTVDRCRVVCRERRTFLVDVNDWDCESRDRLRSLGSDGTTVVCSSGETTREVMSNARNRNGELQRKTIGKCVRRAKMEEKDFVDKMGR